MYEKEMKPKKDRKTVKSLPKKKLLQDYYQGILSEDLNGRCNL